MAFFSTFYSFKGGVGRTLALANVATLLAQDRDEPCRVLVWDFDLAAPGLQNVFKCRWGKSRLGFLDYVHQYLTTGMIEDIANYIYKTDVDGVDILPAGADRRYPQRLEDIKWRQIYREARGFDFIEAVKKQIENLAARYDYVLIDSLTGYSDAGGICVRQIPDAVVFLFRLNEQNLEGIKNVYRALRQNEENKQASVPVIPVISPAWPFASLEANAWIPRAKGVFPSSKILEISFEGALTLGEQVISKIKDQFSIVPKIIEDYDSLTRALRDRNPQDVKTMFKEIPALRSSGQFKEAAEHALAILERRANRSAYWDEFVATFYSAPKNLSDLQAKASEFIRAQMLVKNPYAFVASSKLKRGPESWDDRIKLLTEALEIEPTLAQAYSQRGALFESKGLISEAIEDYTRLLELPWRSRTAAYMQRGRCYYKRFLFENAVLDFNSVLKVRPRDVNALLHRAKSFLGIGQYEAALQDADKYLTLTDNQETGHLVKTYAYAFNGQLDKAIAEIEIIRSLDSHSDSNIAEAYLAIDPTQTISLLARHALVNISVKKFLSAFAHELVGNRKEATELLNAISDGNKGGSWSFFEARLLIDILLKRRVLNEDFAERLLETTQRIEDEDQSSLFDSSYFQFNDGLQLLFRQDTDDE
jgi:MinD-like ATPase involved in chromosome partitioning or flagellar assembly